MPSTPQQALRELNKALDRAQHWAVEYGKVRGPDLRDCTHVQIFAMVAEMGWLCSVSVTRADCELSCL